MLNKILNAASVKIPPRIRLILCLAPVFLFFNGKAPAYEKPGVYLQKKKIDRVEQSILDHEEKLLQSGIQEKKLLKRLKKIDHQIFLESRKYIALEEKIHEQEELLREKEGKLEELKREKERLQQHIKKRLTAYYQMGDIGMINAVFSSASLPDLLNFREMYGHMLKHDQEAFSAFKDKINAINETRLILEKGREQLAIAVANAEMQQSILAAKRQEQQDILNEVKTREALYENALKEMKAASRELQMTLADLEGTVPRKTAPIKDAKKIRPNSEGGFAGRKGLLSPPVKGKVIKQFHRNPANGDEPVFSEGINIETGPGDKIRAIYKGEVIYAGMLPGYGKIIILDHGDHYVSLVSGIDNFIKDVGERVEEGDVIATANLHSGLLRDGIHFEIRHKTRPADPLAWLDPLKVESNFPDLPNNSN